VLAALAGAEGQAGDDGCQFGRIDGLGNMGLETRQKRAFPILRSGKRGEGGRRDALGRGIGPHPVDQIISILLGHANITNDHIRLKSLDQGQGFGSGGGDGDVGLAIGEGAAQELAGVRLVIDDKYLEAREGTILALMPIAA
jgi:hypothetical protein